MSWASKTWKKAKKGAKKFKHSLSEFGEGVVNIVGAPYFHFTDEHKTRGWKAGWKQISGSAQDIAVAAAVSAFAIDVFTGAPPVEGASSGAGAVPGPTGMEIEAAAGSGQGVWVEPASDVFGNIPTGAGAVPGPTGMEIEAAAGSGVAPWVEPSVAAGASSTESMFAGSGAYLLKAGEVLGISAIGKNLLGQAIQPAVDKANQFVNEVFGGSTGGYGPGGEDTMQGGGSAGGLFSRKNMPWLIIAIVLLGAFLLFRKRRI